LRFGARAPISEAVSEFQHPLRREGLLRRFAPFLAIALLAFAAVPISSAQLNLPALFAAAGLLAVIAAAVVFVPWDRLPPSAAAVPPIAYFVVVALLVQTAGGGPSGYVPLVLLPIFWLALYGTRSELAIAMVAAFSMFVAPLIFLHNRQYSQSELREALLWMAVSVVVGFTAQRLVRTIREHAEESDRQKQALLVSEERQRLILETAGEGFVSMDPKGEISAWNASAERIFGWSGSEAIGRPFVETLVPTASREAFRRALERFPGEDEESLIGSTTEQRALHRDGHEISVEVTISPLRVGDGIVFNSFVRDITERQEAQREAERLKDEFFALVSHELRTPLTSIIGYLELLEEDGEGKLDEEDWHHIGVMQRNADRLLRLVGDILLVAQVQAGTFTVHPTEMDVSSLIEHAVDAAMPKAEATGIELNLHGNPTPQIEGDHDRLAQLVDNLVTNALKFTPAGERIDVTCCTRDGAVLIEVANTGSYLGPDEQEQLFERFFRANDAVEGAIGGVGLGLAICKAIAEAHGGEISVRSTENEGTTFSVRLPVASPPESRRREHEPQGAIA
jgi:PAS domain S-box-containing protein